MSEASQRADRILDVIVHWVRARRDIGGLALVGSHARGTARPDSDIDLVLLVADPETFRSDASWVGSIDWSGAGMCAAQWRDEDYGNVWSRRVWLDGGVELEISFAPLSWACITPLDAGTRRVIEDGCRILDDPDGSLDRLCRAVNGITELGAPVP
jgi:uncharacterized protein